MATIRRFEDIEAWQTARELTRQVYQVTHQGDFARDFGLRDQMRRAVVSSLSNIAEDFESRTQALFLDVLGRAKGSPGEVRAQCYVALDVGSLTELPFAELTALCERGSRQPIWFMSYLESHQHARRVREDRVEYEL